MKLFIIWILIFLLTLAGVIISDQPWAPEWLGTVSFFTLFGLVGASVVISVINWLISNRSKEKN